MRCYLSRQRKLLVIPPAPVAACHSTGRWNLNVAIGCANYTRTLLQYSPEQSVSFNISQLPCKLPHAHNPPPPRLQHLHDLRLVLSSKEHRHASMEGNNSQLGDCFLRILFNGACQQVWIRGRFFCFPVEDDTGSDHPHGVFSVCGSDLKRKLPLELFGFILLFIGSRFLYVPEISLAKL
jgi:hypothetical protein